MERVHVIVRMENGARLDYIGDVATINNGVYEIMSEDDKGMVVWIKIPLSKITLSEEHIIKINSEKELSGLREEYKNENITEFVRALLYKK
jgi:hypothetical protein